MRYQIQIVGEEGLIYDHLSEAIDRHAYKGELDKFIETNKRDLYDLMEPESIIYIITNYDDAETDKVEYYKELFCREFKIIEN